MIIKVEAHYEVRAAGDLKIPETIKSILVEKVSENLPNEIILEESFWRGKLLSAKLLTKNEILERIRTAK